MKDHDNHNDSRPPDGERQRGEAGSWGGPEGRHAARGRHRPHRGGPDGHRGGPEDRRGGPEGRRGGPEGRGRPGGRRGGGDGGRRRAQRGDVRAAILLLLAEEPMHGYQLMQAMRDRTNGAWRPSPGAVYPTLDHLEDEGLATIRQDGGRRLVTLTDEGRAHLSEKRAELSDPFAEHADGASGPDLRGPLEELHVAARQISVNGDPAQREAAATVLAQARRSLYLILAGDVPVAPTRSEAETAE